ncbi:MAG: FAD:protein FMN transferase [Saprospiraceae bacterium]|jgi:thiamine biosynthesis lipoprotein|nr:FAD:protein FMN transferase [Saprospiraceae bacterium]
MHKTLFILSTAVVLFLGCNPAEMPYYKLEGPTMGTTYHITLQCDEPAGIQASMDSILADFNLSMSAYIDSSTLTKFNVADSIYCFTKEEDPYFEPIFQASREVWQKSGGMYNPAIAPLVNYYGFGYKEKKKLENLDTLTVKNLLSLTHFDSIRLESDSASQFCVVKLKKGMMLDFNSLAPGYAVDLLSSFLEKKGLRNFMIELGGEVRALGVNAEGKEWIIGINTPNPNAKETDIELPLKISNRSLATSGNYRSMYESKGQKYAHIINPVTGMSQPTDILSATVIAQDCMMADAWATAFMVMGMQKSLDLAPSLKGIDACFIYDAEGDGVFEFKMTEGFSSYYLHNEQK